MISGVFWLDLLQAITNPLQGFLNMVLYGHHFFAKYKQYCCSKKKIKKTNSKTSLLSADSTGGDSQKKQKSPDSEKKAHDSLDEIKFGVIYTERTKADSPTDHLVPKSVYYYHLDTPYEVEEEYSEEESISTHFNNVPNPLLPNYFTNEQPLYSSIASSGGQHGLRIIHQNQMTPILGNYNNSHGGSNGEIGSNGSLRPNGIRFMHNDFSVYHSGGADEILD
jgi:hypothetical protein